MVCFRAALGTGLAVFGLASSALAAGDRGFISAAATQTEDTWQQQGVKGHDQVTIYNLSGGYQLATGITLGLKYFNYNQNGDSTQDTGVVTSGAGPMAGYYHQSGAFVMASYLMLEPQKKYEVGNVTTTYSDGNGQTIDLGYCAEIGSSWGVGAQVTYSKVTYKKAKTGSQPVQKLSGTWADTSLYPYVSFFLFL